MNFVPCVRWSGGKRKQSEDIIARMPEKIKTCWIPFLGGGSVMFQLLNSNIEYERIVVSDIYQPLMGIWELIKNDPKKLIDAYTEMYNNLSEIGESYYYEIVNKFNEQEYGNQSPEMFYFITRACMRGSIEYDSNGNFTTKLQASSQSSDRIASPSNVASVVNRWNECMQDVELRCESYDCTEDEVQPGDFVFLDPPYIDGTWYHDNHIDMDRFYEFLRNLPCDYSVTLNGDKDIYPIPEDCYTKHEYIYYGMKRSKSGRPIGSRDSLWQKRTDSHIYNDINKNVRQNQKSTGGKIPPVNDLTMLASLQKQIDETNERMNDVDNKLSQILNLLSK